MSIRAEAQRTSISLLSSSTWWIEDHRRALSSVGMEVAPLWKMLSRKRGEHVIPFARLADVRFRRVLRNFGVFQCENPLTRYHQMTSQMVILTDPVYFPYFPNAAEWRWAPEEVDGFARRSNRDIDLLVVGSSRRGGNPSELSREIARGAINSFQGAPECLVWSPALKSFLRSVRRGGFDEAAAPSVALRSEIDDAQARLNFLRRLRRESIVREVLNLDGRRRVVIVGDISDAFEGFNQSSEHPNIEFVKYSSWKRIIYLAQRSKLFLVTNPALPNTQNERFRIALRAGAIPLVEPFPVYDDFGRACDEIVRFDYDGLRLSNAVENCLARFAELRSTVGDFASSQRITELEEYLPWVLGTFPLDPPL